MPSEITDRASAEIRNLIFRRHYRPGDRLPPERELATALAVSRPTIREAIGQLTEAGLLQARQGSGTYVAEVDLAGLFEVRLRLEPLAAELAAGRRSDEQAAELRDLLADLKAALPRADHFAALDVRIHQSVATASANQPLMDLLGRLGEQALVSRGLTSPSQTARKQTLADLGKVVSAVSRSDAGAAGEAMFKHLDAIRDIALRRSEDQPRSHFAC